MNPLLELSNNKHNAIPFDKIEVKHFIPALEETIKNAYKNLEIYKADDNENFDSVILKLEEASEMVDYVVTVFYALYGAHSTKEIQDISEEFSNKLTKFGSDFTLDSGIFKRVKALHDKHGNLTLEQEKVLEHYYKDFSRNGALLNDDDKNILRDIDEKLASLNLKFSKNVLDATNAYELHITDEEQLDGLPQNAIEAAFETAKAKGKEGWIITLQYPSYIPFMTYSKNEKLREEVYRASTKKAYKDEFDNSTNVLEIIALKEKRSKLLGFKTHADFVLEKRMAATPKQVYSFLDNLLDKSMKVAKEEKKKIEDLKKELDCGELKNWDLTYYSEKLKMKELDFDEEMLRPYFQLEKVIDGVFQVASKLYGVSFKEDNSIPKYHEEVKTYEVLDCDGNFISLFYADFFPRETKRGGAWMTNLFEQGYFGGEIRRPHVSIVCNFTKPTSTTPSLLSFNEVTTLFHEFGHALHGMLTQCKYRTLSGTSVYWDFVELPSQVLENWVYEKECLDLFAVHYKTGEKIPTDLIDKIKKSSKFLAGLGTIRQLSLGYLDMAWHTTPSSEIKDVLEFERNAQKKASVFEAVDGACMSTAFSHIFAGGYSAGYYSYKWAEVLDADAFEYFQEEGIFNADVAKKFQEFILEKGGTEHPMELYKKFRGREPKVDALLRRAGLT